MPIHRRRSRLGRLLLWILCLLLAGLLWKAFWRFGPGIRGGPALFELQARALLLAHLGRTQRVEALLPAPEKGTSAEAQLRLMELWDGRTWTAKAARAGRVVGRSLRVSAGQLEPAGILAISAEQVQGDRRSCRIDYRVRWNWPDQDRELLRVAAIVGLRTPGPAGLAAPGQESARTLLLERDGWSWRPAEPRPAAGPESWRTWLPLLF